MNVATSSVRAADHDASPVHCRRPSPWPVMRLKTWMNDVGGSGEAVEDARVVISELVANSVRHAQPLSDGQILVSWTLEDRGLQLSVTDGGSGTRPAHGQRALLGAGRPRHGDRRDPRRGVVDRAHRLALDRARAAAPLSLPPDPAPHPAQ